MSYTTEQKVQLFRRMGMEFLTLLALEANGMNWDDSELASRRGEIENILAEMMEGDESAN